MLKNFRNGVLAQLVLLAVVGCPMTLHATPLTCVSTIVISGGSGFVLNSDITSGTCVQVGDKLFGDFAKGKLPSTGIILFSSTSNSVSITFNDPFKAGTDYKFDYEVAVINSPNFISSLGADIIQTLGTSSLSSSTTPTGTGSMNFTKTGNVVSGNNVVSFTEAQGVTDLTVVTESFQKDAHSDATAVLNTITQSPPTPVPEPASSTLLGSVMGLGLASFGWRGFLKK